MFALFDGPAVACTIGEEAQVQLPFNATDISNADRLAIANIVIEAKKWPDVEIQAVVIAGAYKNEKNVERLKETRADIVKAYLQQLGIKIENILIDRKTFTDEMLVKHPDGAVTIRQIVIELTPICKGSCARLCDDPRVTPTSKAIK
ncbi:hypothetical protein [Burkholderia metallica]|uniref:hypothetical protein n=1 Tax=Burkholderia metallica TaxID=488729 RepID=UPI001CF56DDE|nr:hypothetical protein [Burkholderia metallica]MCA8016836.1 hypothetical protein [Burkholderia metallica]